MSLARAAIRNELGSDSSLSHAKRLSSPSPDLKIWLVDLDSFSPAELDRALQSLSELERRRAQDFRFPEERNRYVAAHFSLRHLLAAELGLAATDLTFASGPYGKPLLERSNAGRSLHFNLAHSRHLALIALSASAEMGVDLEALNSVGKGGELSDLAARIFSAHELRHWRELPENLRRIQFTQTWVRKEAFAKAVGEGLRLELNTVEIDTLPNDTLVIRRADAETLHGWNLRDLSVGEDFVGAIVWRDCH